MHPRPMVTFSLIGGKNENTVHTNMMYNDYFY